VDLRTGAQLTEIRAVYVPFWIFSTEVRTYWTADSSRTPMGASASWYPVSGRGRRTYDDLWIAAGAGVPAAELQPILPYDASAGVPPDSLDLVDVTVEQFAVSRRYARPLAQGVVEALELQAVTGEVPGRARHVHVNVLMEGADSRPALAPLYVMAYRYDKQVYRFLLNGQTGGASGTAPVSTKKMLSIIGIVAIVVLIVILILTMR
jgi:hypothetical protein